jgi:hypothetical protein
VVGVAEHNLGAGLDKVSRLQRFDRSEGPDVHENGRLDNAVGGFKPSQPCARARILFYDLKIHCAYFTKKYQKPLAGNAKIVYHSRK